MGRQSCSLGLGRGRREARSCTARKEPERPGAKAVYTPARAKGSEIPKLIFDGPLLTRAEWTKTQALPALSRSQHQAGGWGGGSGRRHRKLVPSARAAAHQGKPPPASSLRSAWAVSSSASPSEPGQYPDASTPTPPPGGTGSRTLQE